MAHPRENSTKTLMGAFSFVQTTFLIILFIFSQGVAKFDQWDIPRWNHSEHGGLEDRRTPCFLFLFPFHNANRLFLTLEIDSLKCFDVPTPKEHAVEAGYCDPNH